MIFRESLKGKLESVHHLHERNMLKKVSYTHLQSVESPWKNAEATLLKSYYCQA